MLKKLVILLFFISTIVQSQQTITGIMSPIDTDVTWVALYKLQGSKQLYVKDVTIENGVFKIELPEATTKGMYRLRYKMDNTSSVDFIYNNESITLKFDPSNAAETIQFSTSEDNKLYYSLLNQTAILKQQLDELQYSYFKLETIEEKIDSRIWYKNTLLNYTKIQQEFEVKSKDKLAFHFIKADKKYYNENLFESAQEYLNSVKSHYFDFIDFSDSYLQRSTLISEHILNYVFYLNVSEDSDVQVVLFKNAITEVVEKLPENVTLRADVLTALLHTFSQNENVAIVNYLMEDYYRKLPESAQSEKDIQSILKNIKLAIGQKAPNFSWEENGESKSLYALDITPAYLLVFWSTSCSHCIVEIPKLYEFLNNKVNIHVIDVALEKDELGFAVYDEKFKKWTNVLGLGKWENPIAKNYEIVSTPTYFILDSEKIIISKPDNIEDLKVYFRNE